MGYFSATLLLASSLLAAGDPPAPPPAQLKAGAPVVTEAASVAPAPPCAECNWFTAPAPPPRNLFQSDRAFDNFIGPITNPVFAKDPRSLTEARLLFIQNHIDNAHPLGSGDFQVYGCQLRLALTDRLTFIADKDGYAVIEPAGGGNRDGWLNLAAGFKYVLIRDVENQFLVTCGFQYEIPNGEGEVFQSHGDGIFSIFGTVGKEIAKYNHVLLNVGGTIPVDRSENSSFYYASLHLDHQLLPWLYPLVEFNWFHWVSGGDRGIPAAIGEGDGLINIGTSGVAGNDLVTCAVGLKGPLARFADLGAAWEFPLSNRHDLLGNRLTVELILRY